MFESGMVVDTTIPNSIILEAFHKSLGRNDLRHSFPQGTWGEKGDSSAQAPVLPPNQACFSCRSRPRAAAWEGQP